MRVDTLIFGGGAAGLWLLDELLRSGRSALLLEAGRLGQGQTIASQGIIHGGLKYTLQGLMTPSAAEIRDMPALWRECLSGRRQPDLRQTRVRSPHCYLWRTDSMRSRLGMIGAKFGLRVAPSELPADRRPEILRQCPGTVAQLEEQVISPAAFLGNLLERNRRNILQIDSSGLRFQLAGTGQVARVVLRESVSQSGLEIEPAQVVFTAGGGNAALRQQAGLSPTEMQRRPLHMVMLRGDLPALNGHCVDGARTRVTITSDVDASGRTIWQVGGQIAEEGVQLEPQQLVARAAAELRDVLPGLDLEGVELAACRVDRAERKMKNGRRPETVQVLCEGNILTAWPTKLALVPQLARAVSVLLTSATAPPPALPEAWRRPLVAAPPWETCATWYRLEERSNKVRRAA